jgi:hypothetical protein
LRPRHPKPKKPICVMLHFNHAFRVDVRHIITVRYKEQYLDNSEHLCKSHLGVGEP